MTSTATDKNTDLFNSDEFLPEKQIIPWLQVLNAEDPERAGFFISIENCKSADIIIPESWKPFKARFKSGETDRTTGRFIPNTTDGYLFTDARFLVVRQGTLSMFSKRTASAPEAYIGTFDYKVYREQKDSLILKTKHLVYLLSDDNQLLHQSPIQFTGKGVFGATFSEHLRAFQSELQKSYGKQRGAKFLINGVFCCKTASELRGESPNTAWVSVIESHLVPTKETWKDLFVGYDDALREKLLSDYEAFSDFDKKSSSQEKTVVDAGASGITNIYEKDSVSNSEPPDEDDIPW
jgi:hypothetical protein